MMLTLCALLLAGTAEAKDFGTVIDPESASSSKPAFDTRAFVQIRPAFEAHGQVCTAIQVDDKILLMAGKCATHYKQSVMIPTWRKLSYRAIEKTQSESEDLALVLIQTDHCSDLKGVEKHVFSPAKSADAVPADQQAQIVFFGGTGFRYGGPDKDAEVDLQVAPIEIKDGVYHASRTVEISETPVTREMITRREGTMILDGGAGAIFVQKDKSGEWMIGGVLSATEQKVEQAMVSVRQEGQKPIEFEVSAPEDQWVDPSKSALDLASVKSELAKRGLKDKKFEISRSYRLSVTNKFTAITDPKNQEFFQKTLTDLRAKRDEKIGCGRKTASR